jgi:hypothetical protein
MTLEKYLYFRCLRDVILLQGSKGRQKMQTFFALALQHRQPVN